MLYACKAYLALLNRLPYQAMWDQDTQDAEGVTVAFSEQQYTNAVNKKVSSMVFLSHEPYGIVHSFSIRLADVEYQYFPLTATTA